MNSVAKNRSAHPLRSILSNWGGFLFAATASFFLSPYILGKLGSTSFGVWALIGSLIGYLGLLDLGVRSAVTKFIASYHVVGDHGRASDIKSAALLVFMVAGLTAVILASAFSMFVGEMFSIPPESLWVARLTIVILAINVATSLINGVFGGILTARHRFDLVNVIYVFGIFFRTIAIVIFLESEYVGQQSDNGIIALAIIQLLSSLIELALTRVASRKVYPEVLFSVRRAFSPENLRKVFSFGLQSSAIHVLGAVAHKSSLIIIGAIMPVAMVTYYSISETLAEYARQIVSGISHTVVPMVSSMEGAGQMDRVKRVLVDGTRLSNLAVLPIIATFIVRGETFISLWMGVDYGPQSGQILIVLSVALWAMIGYQICTTTMIGLGRQKSMVPIFAVEAAMGISLSIVLVRYYGVIGAAWGVLLPRLFVALVLSVLTARKVLHIRVAEYYLHSILRPLLAILPFAAVSYGIETTYAPDNLAMFFLQVALACPAAAAGSWFFGLKASERHAIAIALKRRLSRD